MGSNVYSKPQLIVHPLLERTFGTHYSVRPLLLRTGSERLGTCNKQTYKSGADVEEDGWRQGRVMEIVTMESLTNTFTKADYDGGCVGEGQVRRGRNAYLGTWRLD